MPKKLKRRHHTVPKLILKNFASDGGRRLLAWRRGGAPFPMSVVDATVRRDFYNYTDASGSLDDAVEDWLSEHVEGPAALVLNRIVGDSSQPSATETSVLAAFAASALLRTATTRQYLHQIGNGLGPLMLMSQAFDRTGLKPGDLTSEGLARAQVAAQAKWEEFRPDDTRGLLRTILRKHDEMTTEMTKWRWSVLSSPDPTLIVSDAPVATIGLSPGWHGILPEGSPVYLPISPSQLLVGEPHALGAVSTQLAPELARVVNERIAAECNEAIFTSPEYDWPSYVRLGPNPPSLPPMNVRWSVSDPSTPPTFPASFPEVTDPAVTKLIDALGGTDIVE